MQINLAFPPCFIRMMGESDGNFLLGVPLEQQLRCSGHLSGVEWQCPLLLPAACQCVPLAWQALAHGVGLHCPVRDAAGPSPEHCACLRSEMVRGLVIMLAALGLSDKTNA